MKSRPLSLLALAVAVAPSLPSFAQSQDDSTSDYALEEVYVTAQKRVQTLRDVPISVNALSEEKIEKSGITSIERIADYIPNFNMTQTGIGTNIAIRGISSGVNQGFEQSAAQFVDGIHYGRAQLARAPFLDIERVEVLRGPQSILFGKNSTAGAISITTAKPTDDVEGKVTVLYEPEHNERDVRVVLSGGITDTLSGRLAILNSQMDGFIKNTTLNRDESGDENKVARLSLHWQPTDDWDIHFKVEDGSFDSVGRNIEVVNMVTNPDKGPVNLYSDLLKYLTAPNPYILDSVRDGNRQSNGDYSYNDTENVTLSIERDLGEHTLTSVTGYNAYNYAEKCDCDFIGAPGFNIISEEDYQQFSQELRIASAEDQAFSYIGGVFFQSSKLKFHDMFDVPQDSFIPTALGSTLGATLANQLRLSSTQRNFNQDTDLAAIFAQGTWHMTDNARLIVGARYTEEEKTAERHQYHVTPTGTVLPEGDVTDTYNVLWSVFKIDPHQVKGKRDESGFTPSVTFQYDVADVGMMYASYTTGFKSGGFDVRSNATPNELGGIYPNIEGSWEFEDEKVQNYELGGKFRLGSRADINIAIFRSEFEDMQTSQFDGSLSFNVTNAGEAVVQGIEIDGRWAATDDIMVRYGVAYTDFEYTDFRVSQCYFGQVDNIGIAGDGVCDATGQRREFTPEYQGNLGFDHTFEFSNGLKVVSTLDVIYTDEYLTTPSLDPRFVQEAYTKINARIALSGSDDQWELALVGKNLTDETIIPYANGLPVASLVTKETSSGYYAFYERPRSVALQATLRF